MEITTNRKYAQIIEYIGELRGGKNTVVLGVYEG